MGVDYSAVLGYGTKHRFNDFPQSVQEDSDYGVAAIWAAKDMDDLTNGDLAAVPVEFVVLSAYTQNPYCVLLVKESMRPGFHDQDKESDWKNQLTAFLALANMDNNEPKWILELSVW